jgi:hypothetical protein
MDRPATRKVVRVPVELLVRCQDLEEPDAFFRAYRRRLQAGFRFVYDDPQVAEAEALQALLARIRSMPAPPEFLGLIARDSQPRIRAAAAGNSFLSLDDVVMLASDPVPMVRRAAAANPWAVPELLRRLARDPVEDVRDQVAAHLATPPDVLLDLVRAGMARSGSTEALAVIAEHPLAPEAALTRLALVPFRDGWLVARRPNLPVSTIEIIVEFGPDRCRADLARNQSLDTETLSRLATDSTPVVRIALARNPRTPDEIFERLLKDPDPAVRGANPRASGLELTRLIDVRSRVVTEQVASNPFAPASLLDRLARTWDSDVHAAVAANPATAPETLRYLFGGGGDLVRHLCLENPACPEDFLRARAGAAAPHWRAAVAANPCTPQEVLEALCGDPAPEVIDALAGNPSLPHARQRALLGHPAGRAGNPLAPPDLLWTLAIYENNDNLQQRRRAMANPAFARAYAAVTTWREDPDEDPLAPSAGHSDTDC